MSRVSYGFSHFFQLVSVLSHGREVCYNQLSLDHVVILISGSYNADFSGVSGFKFSNNDVPSNLCFIGVINCHLELWGNT